jgi:uncharacterized protein YidB (DUF937 family)
MALDQIMGVAQNLLGKDSPIGGLDGILSKLQASGLDDQVKSWIGQGPNKPVSGRQVKQALGDEQVKQVANEAGVSEDVPADGLAEMLPDLVNELMPDGKLPDLGNLDDVFKGRLGK